MTKLGNINLFVRDVAKSLQFYTEVLELSQSVERSELPHFALLEAGSCTITLQDAATPGFVSGDSVSVELGFEVMDIASVRQRFEKWSLDVSQVQQMGWGSGFDAYDLDGHRLTIYRMRE